MPKRNAAVARAARSVPKWNGTRRDGDRLARMALSPDGVILDCNAAAARALGFGGEALRGEHVSRVFPQLGAVDLLSEGRVNPRLAFLCRVGVPLEGVRADGGRIAVALSPYTLRNSGPVRVLLAWAGAPSASQ